MHCCALSPGSTGFSAPSAALSPPKRPGKAQPEQVRLLLLTQPSGPSPAATAEQPQVGSQKQLSLSLADLLLPLSGPLLPWEGHPAALRRVPHGGLGTSVPFACLMVSGRGQQCTPSNLSLSSTYHMLCTDSQSLTYLLEGRGAVILSLKRRAFNKFRVGREPSLVVGQGLSAASCGPPSRSPGPTAASL